MNQKQHRKRLEYIRIGCGFAFVCMALLLIRKTEGDMQMLKAEYAEHLLIEENGNEKQLPAEKIQTNVRIQPNPTVLPVNQHQEPTMESPTYSRWERLGNAIVMDSFPDDPRQKVRKAAEINDDIIGILEAGDAATGFIVQGTDNTFYLTHDYTGQQNDAGALFLDARCTLEPRNRSMIIHGHNMRNGTAFGKLKNYRDEMYARKHPYVTITWRDTVETYEVYAVVDINADPGAEEYFKITRWDFETEEGFLMFAQYFADHSLFKFDVNVSEVERLLLLSTCSYTYEDGRQIVACRYIG